MLRFKSITLALAFVLFFSLPAAAQPFTLNEEVQMTGVTFGHADCGDVNNDGYYDYAYTGKTFDDNYFSSLLINDVHNNFQQYITTIPQTEQGALQWGDYNNDNRLDFIVSGIYNHIYGLTEIYRNKGFNIFALQDFPAIAPAVSTNTLWGYLTNEQYLDILHSGVTPQGVLITHLYENHRGVNFIYNADIVLPGKSQGDVCLGDLNDDGYTDIFLTGINAGFSKTSEIFYNMNGNNYYQANGVDYGVYSARANLFDYNNDGYLDILFFGSAKINGITTEITKLYKNNYGLSFSENNDVVFPSLSQGSMITGDFDNDGYADIVISGWHAVSTSAYIRVTKFYQNNGDETFTELETNLPNASSSTLSVADYDNDYDLDVFITGGTNNGYISQLYTNNAEVGNIRPNVLNNLETEITDNTVLFSWDEGTDLNQPTAGLNYNLYIYEEGKKNFLRSPMAFPYTHELNGKRLIARRGEIQGIRQNGRVSYLMNIALDPCKAYYWSVQSIDASFAGGPFAPEVRIAQDTEPPVIICPPSQSVTIPEGETSYEVTGALLDAAATDNCTPILSNSISGNPTLLNANFPAGTYDILWTATDSTGNSNSCTMQLTVKDFVGIKTLPEDAITVTPNPTSGLLTITSPVPPSKGTSPQPPSKGEYMLTLTDVAGNEVQHYQITESAHYQIDLSALPDGMYFLHIRTEAGAAVRKVVLQR